MCSGRFRQIQDYSVILGKPGSIEVESSSSRKRNAADTLISSKKGLLYLKSSNQLVNFPYYLKHTNLCITLLVICMDKKLKHVLVGFRLRPTNT